MFPPAPRHPLNATEIGLLHQIDHVLTVLLEREREVSLEETRPYRPVTEPNVPYRRHTGPLPQTGPLTAP